MPVHRGRDYLGPFYQWGEHGKRYRYSTGDVRERAAARRKAEAQGRAAYANGYRGA